MPTWLSLNKAGRIEETVLKRQMGQGVNVEKKRKRRRSPQWLRTRDGSIRFARKLIV